MSDAVCKSRCVSITVKLKGKRLKFSSEWLSALGSRWGIVSFCCCFTLLVIFIQANVMNRFAFCSIFNWNLLIKINEFYIFANVLVNFKSWWHPFHSLVSWISIDFRDVMFRTLFNSLRNNFLHEILIKRYLMN